MPSLNFGDAPTWLQWLLAVAAVLAFIGGGVRAIPPAWKFVTRFVTTMNDLGELPAELAELRTFRTETAITLAKQNTALARQDKRIAEIHHEVHFNNGSSVKDAAVRTEKAVTRVEEGVAGLYDEIDTLKKADAELRDDFQKTQPSNPTEGESS